MRRVPFRCRVLSPTLHGLHLQTHCYDLPRTSNQIRGNRLPKLSCSIPRTLIPLVHGELKKKCFNFTFETVSRCHFSTIGPRELERRQKLLRNWRVMIDTNRQSPPPRRSPSRLSSAKHDLQKHVSWTIKGYNPYSALHLSKTFSHPLYLQYWSDCRTRLGMNTSEM